MAVNKITFSNAQGDRLIGRLELPVDQHPKAYALFAHCFTCNKNLSAVRNISKALTEKGFGVFRFDFTGLGESEGDFADTNFSSNIDDLVAAGNFMESESMAPSLIIGHSLGGAAVIFAGKELDSVKAVATIGAPSAPDHVQHLIESGIPEIEEKGQAQLTIGGRPFTIKKQFLEDIAGVNMQATVKSLRKPIFVAHSPQDDTVGINNAAEIYSAAMHPKSFLSLDGADHLLSNVTDSTYVGQMIAAWADRYLEAAETVQLRTNHQVLVHSDPDSGYTLDVQAGKHTFKADEPVSIGGNDFGPTPYDLLLASLGACTAITMRMYANRKGWPVEDIEIHLNHGQEHLKDCEDCDSSNAKIDVIERSIKIKGDLDEKQRKRMMQIADKCPVHKTLHNDIRVESVEI
ncbi:MAG: putative OsmC-like protein/esterase/lipase [Flavobacteriales bacterium]|jgi:uncharacterized OsmC-like protein/esterase/lipase